MSNNFPFLSFLYLISQLAKTMAIHIWDEKLLEILSVSVNTWSHHFTMIHGFYSGDKVNLLQHGRNCSLLVLMMLMHPLLSSVGVLTAPQNKNAMQIVRRQEYVTNMYSDFCPFINQSNMLANS